ncbi:amino acid adenylation domain-containing protein, partial [Actinomadura viridis]|nr:amino acid adenylation domain-containing protein [Actinomadura viridis]
MRLGGGRYRLVVTMHHIVIDGWSTPVLFQELEEIYAAGGDAGGLPPVTPYREYLAWLARQDKDAARDAWRRELAGTAEPTLVGLAESAVVPVLPRHVTARAGQGLTHDLEALARGHRLTLNTVIQGAWGLVLATQVGRDDVVFGATVAGRPADLPGVERMLGLFANTVPVRVRLDPARPFGEMLAELQARRLDLMAHQHLGLAEIQRAAGPGAGFDTLMAYQNYPRGTAAPPGPHDLRVTGAEGEDASHYPLTLLAASADTLDLRLEYRPDVFDEAAATALLRRLVRVLEQVAADPSVPIAKVEVLDPAERRLVFPPWNESTGKTPDGMPGAVPDAMTDEAPQRTLADLFDEQAARAPGSVAVVFEGEALSYGELDARANRLAHELIARGVGPEDLVGVVMERSADLVAVLLGVVKAGAAYVPVDPGYPADRVASMLADACPAVVVCTSTTAHLLPGTTDAATDATGAAPPDGTGDPAGDAADSVRIERLIWDDEATAAALAARPATAPADTDRTAPLRSEHPAYVIYTSGSTGRPKGVVVPHANVVRLLRETDHWFGFGTDDVWTLFHSYAFDFSVWELWGALAYGGRLVVVPHLVSRSPREFLALLAAERVTVLNQTPSAFYQLAAADAAAPAPELALRYVVFGGESLEPGRLVDWYARHPGPSLVNMYGITETTVHVTHVALDAETCAAEPGSVIGGPIPDLRVHVLDGRLKPVPPGVPGEVHVAGPGLARGYLHRPGLSAQRFVADVNGPPGSRMYRSGDLARWRPDGTLEHLGRADRQVQLRGFRIEPGEIEVVLAAHERVGQAAVVVREDRPGVRRLVAYVVPAAGNDRGDDRGDGRRAGVDERALREFAAARLPGHMVPAAVVVLDELPVTVNGKLDRDALPAPEFGGPAATGRAPATPAEEVVCGLFAEVLGLESVSADDSFFEVGGDSLLAMRLIARVRAVLGAEVTIRELFGSPTVAGVARLADAGRGEARAALAARERPGEVPLSFAQQRMWFLNRLEEGGAGAAYNVPLALRLTGELDVPALEAALGDVADRHESLRTIFPESGGVPHQKIIEGVAGRPALAVTSLGDGDLAEALAGALSGEVARGFDLGRELPWRARLLALPQPQPQPQPQPEPQPRSRPGPGPGREPEHVLVLVAHHIAVDAWSMGVLARDLGVAYAARRSGAAPGWEPLPVQYADYALWQREVLGDPDDPGSLIAAQTAYWRRALAGLPEEIDLPVDRPRRAEASFRAGTVPVRVDADVHARLVQVAQRHGVTMFMVAQAAVAALLARMGAGTDIPLGSAIAGRGEAALGDLAGFFLNTLVLRTDVSGDPSFAELLARVRETDLAAYAHQDLPFERLVEELNPARSLARHPLFQVALSLHHRDRAGSPWELPGLRVRPENAGETVAARVDLEISIAEQRDEGGAPAGIGGVIDYATDLFDEATARALAERLARVLEQVAADPRRRVSDLDVLDEAERFRVVREWNDTARTVGGGSFPELFEAQVTRTPDAVALVSGDRTLSYAELDARADQVAHELIARGAGPERLVGVLMERSADLVAVVLGVAKAGAAYLPIDPAYPAERIAFMLADAAPALVVCTRATEAAAGDAQVERLVWDDPVVAGALNARPATRPAGMDRTVPLRPGHPAYVIYTSGSTGRPKGVLVTHGGVASLAEWQADRFGVGPAARVLQFAALGFDASFWELCMALLSGAALVLGEPDRMPPRGRLEDLVTEYGVTHVTLPPSMLATVEELPDGLGTVVVAGEACPPGLAARWSAGRRMFNAYGPTESTVCATMSA